MNDVSRTPPHPDDYGRWSYDYGMHDLSTHHDPP